MPARGYRRESTGRVRKAALLYLDDHIEMRFCAERFGVSAGSIWSEVKRLRRERNGAGQA